MLPPAIMPRDYCSIMWAVQLSFPVGHGMILESPRPNAVKLKPTAAGVKSSATTSQGVSAASPKY